MVQSGEEPRLGGVEEEITAYFSDIESFSSFSEKLSPKQLVELMNEYLSACTDIVQAEGGTLDKYIGDALVAMYGAPLVLPNHGHRAVVAALRVHRRCAELRAKWKAEQAEKGWPDIVANLQTRIGLNLGRAVVGNMGSHTRFNYTMMGDTVNLAARMESGAKAYGVYTLVTESVVEASRRAEPGAVLFRPLDRIVVKGRSQPVAVFEAMALRADAEASGGRMAECATLFSEGLERYHAQHWDGARERFERSLGLEAHQKNNPSKVMLKRVELMRARPPGPDWDGVWTMESK
jgi:adenylate cyclase